MSGHFKILKCGMNTKYIHFLYMLLRWKAGHYGLGKYQTLCSLLSIKMILFLVKKKLVYRNICSDKRLRSSFSLFTCDSLQHICVQVSRINCQPQEIFYTWVLVLFLSKMILETIKLLMLVFKCSHLASDT